MWSKDDSHTGEHLSSSSPSLFLVKDGLLLNMGFSPPGTILWGTVSSHKQWILPCGSTLSSVPWVQIHLNLDEWLWASHSNPLSACFVLCQMDMTMPPFQNTVSAEFTCAGRLTKTTWTHTKPSQSPSLLPLSREPWIQGRKMKAADRLLGTDRDFWTFGFRKFQGKGGLAGESGYGEYECRHRCQITKVGR